MVDDDETYSIVDWIAPWVDGGERLLSYIYGIKEIAEDNSDGRNDHDVVWQIGMIMLCRQLEFDIAGARAARLMGLNSDPTS